MPASFLEESVAVLARTPALLDALLRNLPDFGVLILAGKDFMGEPPTIRRHLLEQYVLSGRMNPSASRRNWSRVCLT